MGLKRSPMRHSRPKPAVPPDVRAALKRRSGGWCEMALTGCWGAATDPCHRIGRKNGGRHGAARDENNRLSNVIHGCRSCHGWTHDRVTEAEDMGLMLREGDNPLDVPVLLRYDALPVYLDDEGGWHRFEPDGAA